MPKLFRRRLPGLGGAFRVPRKVFNRRFHLGRYVWQQAKTPSDENAQSTGADPKSKRLPLRRRLAAAWTETPTTWYPLPIGVGALLLAVLSWRKRAEQDAENDAANPPVSKGRWQVNVLGALPLRNMSRVWGYVNSFELPVWFRPTGFKLYSLIFGCNLDEIEPSDLTAYASLGEFFYRRLKPGVRPIANASLVSPADGTVLHFGKIVNARVEQVKGLTYSLDALLGSAQTNEEALRVEFAMRQGANVDDEEFANVNGIEYTLNQLLGTSAPGTPGASSPSGASTPLLGHEASTSTPSQGREGPLEDASMPTESNPADTISVAAQMGVSASASSSTAPTPKRSNSVSNVRPGNELFFTVVYLAPGDYHRFHSPTAWVVEKRRHFVGELFSVSPWMAKRLQDLFVLNERVALLGRWRYGFFSMVPVGATNVGSIRVNFDETLRTNTGRRRRVSPGSFAEATYANASPLLRGQPLRPGQEMGGFMLGSTVVLVFEAPPSFAFDVKVGQKVKVGESIGDVPPAGAPKSPAAAQPVSGTSSSSSGKS